MERGAMIDRLHEGAQNLCCGIEGGTWSSVQSAKRQSRGMSSFAALIAATTVLSGVYGAQIKKFEMPFVIRNGTGPVDFACIYEVKEDENGLVIKWYHNEHEQIYQWIPPMAPQDVGIIKGLVEYPEDAINRPMSHSIIRVKEVTLEMDGEYTCSVSTFQEDAIKTTRMIVYVPESNVTIYTPMYNETHVNLTCIVLGARPRPVLMMHVGGVEVNGHSGYTDKYLEDPWIRHQAIIREPEAPSIVECEIVIPHTEYRRREKVVYYPRSHRSTTESSTVTQTVHLLSTTLAP